MKILSASQIRQWDEYTILNEPISSLDLMERAAAKCTDWLLLKIDKATAVKIFCGKGNNGGDGLAIARQLAENGISVDVYIIELGSIGSDDFQANLTRLHNHSVRLHFIQENSFLPILSKEDILLDAMIGTGLKKPIEGLYAETVEHINKSGATVIAIDLPTGMFADKPSATGRAIKANSTLTFQTLKLSFLFPESEEYTGSVEVLNIGLLSSFLATVHSIFQLTGKEMIGQIYKPRQQFSHKGTYGHALIVAGEHGKMGAAVLCSKACLRSGVGLVSTVIPQKQFSILQMAVPEAMAVSQNEISSADWAKYSAIGIGPGLGTSLDCMQMLETVLGHFSNPIVIDADALNIISANKAILNELPPGSILTPHPKEFERLFGSSENHLERIQTARYYSQKLFVYIIIKGHYSTLACPDGEVYFNSTGNAGMATGGMGDVLTGIVTGLLTQAYSPKDACILGMYLHGLSGDIAAAQISQEALTAGDVVDYFGKAFLQVSSY